MVKEAKDAATGVTLTLKYKVFDCRARRRQKVVLTPTFGPLSRHSNKALEISGHGSFGVVLKAELVSGGSGIVALKRCKQDRRYKVF